MVSINILFLNWILKSFIFCFIFLCELFSLHNILNTKSIYKIYIWFKTQHWNENLCIHHADNEKIITRNIEAPCYQCTCTHKPAFYAFYLLFFVDAYISIKVCFSLTYFLIFTKEVYFMNSVREYFNFYCNILCKIIFVRFIQFVIAVLFMFTSIYIVIWFFLKKILLLLDFGTVNTKNLMINRCNVQNI